MSEKSIQYKVSDTQRFTYQSLTGIPSAPAKIVRYTEVSAIWDAHYREVQL